MFKKLINTVSTMRCRVCGGWGGEYGHAKNGSKICGDCWSKGNR